MIKIYYNNKIILFSEIPTSDFDSTKIYFLNEDEIKNSLKEFLEVENSSNLNIYGDKFSALPDYFSEIFHLVEAAGGFVINNSEEFLFIKRLGFFDLPKGKIETNETPESTAIREVCEECGIFENEIKVLDKLPETYHIYYFNHKYFLKKNHWFLMAFSGNHLLKPQMEEDITDIGWLSFDLYEFFIERTYPSLKELLYFVIKKLKRNSFNNK
jgi:8-oxo-dGTP pyrophosphatase MutT (NUDIX family)